MKENEQKIKRNEKKKERDGISQERGGREDDDVVSYEEERERRKIMQPNITDNYLSFIFHSSILMNSLADWSDIIA